MQIVRSLQIDLRIVRVSLDQRSRIAVKLTTRQKRSLEVRVFYNDTNLHNTGWAGFRENHFLIPTRLKLWVALGGGSELKCAVPPAGI